MKRAFALLAGGGLALALSLTGCGSSASGGGDGSGTITIMVGGLDKQIYLPAMLTQKLGYFTDQGLHVQLKTEPAGVQAETAMIAGKVDAVVGFYDHTIDLQGKGKHAESVVQLLRVPGEVELCRSGLKGTVASPADWSKGTKLGVTGLGSSTNFLSEYLAVRNHVPTSDVTSVAVKAGNTFIAAMKHESIDCGMTSVPTVTRLLHTKTAYPIVDMRTARGTRKALGGLYPASALYMRNDYVAEHGATVQKLANAFVSTMHWIGDHTAEQITAKVPPEYYKGSGKDAYISALKAEKDIYTPDGIMPEGGPQTVLKVLGSFDPAVKGKKIDLSKTYTTKFAKKADQGG